MLIHADAITRAAPRTEPPYGMKIPIHRKEIIMPIKKNIAAFLQQYRQERHLSIVELSAELGIAKSAIVEYLNGDGNPRADTVDLIADKCGVSAAEMISAQPPGWERTEIVERAARVFGGLPPERRERAVSLFLALVDILAEGDHA